jgi:hypothetical protein
LAGNKAYFGRADYQGRFLMAGPSKEALLEIQEK